ncbi:MAG: efflux RND transporter periplasmic adaptor subunit [Myxococcota bacterium]|nr:efflux RND transporter periplasmic adaptor subunit [Myxococcota bacterium]
MNKMKIILPLLFLVLGGIAVKTLGSRERTPKKNERKQSAVPVETLKVSLVKAPFSVQSEGTVLAVDATAISAQVSGRVTALSPALKTGGRFKKGEVMLRLDERDYQARVTQAEAGLERANMELALTEQRRSVAQTEYLSSGLAKGNTAHPLAQHEPQWRAAKAAMASAKAGLSLARLALERTVLRAPYDCLVRKRNVGLGEVVGPGRQLVMVAGTAIFEVLVALAPKQLALLRKGGGLEQRKVTVHSRVGSQDVLYTARIDRIEGELEPLGRLARIALRIDAPMSGEAPLLLGSFVQVRIAGTPFESVVVVAEKAFNNGRLFTVDSEDRLQQPELKIVHRRPGFVFIGAGLNDGDELVVSRLRNPIAGTKVKRLNVDAKASKP